MQYPQRGIVLWEGAGHSTPEHGLRAKAAPLHLPALHSVAFSSKAGKLTSP